jgi:hypothetical protein
MQPDVLRIRVVHERLLKDAIQSPAAVWDIIERERLTPALFRDSVFCRRPRA